LPAKPVFVTLPPAWHPSWLHHHPHRWQAGTLDRQALIASAQDVADRPGFLSVAQRFARCWLKTQHDNPVLRTVFRNSQRYMLLVGSLVLHHQRNRADSGSGLTPAAMCSFFEHARGSPFGAGESQIRAMLAHARLHHLIEPAPDSGDKRFRPLVPTALLRHIFEQWVGGFLQAHAGERGFELPAPWAEMVAVPGLVAEVFSYRMAALREDGFVLAQPVAADLRWVLQHDHGYRVFLHCVEGLQGQADGSALVDIRASTLATCAGVARGTVRNMLQAATQQGWFTPVGASPTLCRWPTAQMRTTLLWIALELVWMHGLACAAWSRRGHYAA
jgi:hypothetical protein